MTCKQALEFLKKASTSSEYPKTSLRLRKKVFFFAPARPLGLGRTGRWEALAEDFTGILAHILSQYARDIPVFSTIDSKYELFSAFRQLLAVLDKLLVDSMQDQTLVEKFDTRHAELRTATNLLKQDASESVYGQQNSVCCLSDVFLARNMLKRFVVGERPQIT